MRKPIVTNNMSLDRVITSAAAAFDPLGPRRSGMAAITAEHSHAADGLSLGRRTFEAFRTFSPNQSRDPDGPRRLPQPGRQLRAR